MVDMWGAWAERAELVRWVWIQWAGLAPTLEHQRRQPMARMEMGWMFGVRKRRHPLILTQPTWTRL